jgi:dCMP deaminase
MSGPYDNTPYDRDQKKRKAEEEKQIYPLRQYDSNHYELAIPRIKPRPIDKKGNIDKFNLSFDETAMAMAIVTSLRSKDTITKVGVVIADQNDIIRGTGYNGMPRGCPETEIMWAKENKNDYVIHAEVNALLNYHGPKSKTDKENALNMYTTLFPCLDCAKKIANTSIRNVIYQYKKPHKIEDNKKVNDLFNQCGIALIEFSTLKFHN